MTALREKHSKELGIMRERARTRSPGDSRRLRSAYSVASAAKIDSDNLRKPDIAVTIGPAHEDEATS